MLHLVNYPTTKGSVKRSFNKAKLESLGQAIATGNWSDPIFNDPTLPQLAMSLFAKGTITKQQTISTLERTQTLNDYFIENTYPIFKPDGETLTAEAEQFLLPILEERNKQLKPLSKEQIKEFRWLVASLPKSEQFFYTTSVKTKSGREPTNHLQDTLVALSAAYKTDNSMVHLSCGARDALGLARFGQERYVPPIDRFGIQTPDNIEEGVRQSARYAALSYPETPSFKPGLHGHSLVNDYEATTHDAYHSNVMSTMTPEIRAALLYLVDVIRPKMKHTWSLELWDYIDADFMHTFRTHQQSSTEKLTPQQTTELFCTLLLRGSGGGSHFSNGGFLARRDKEPFDFLEINFADVFQKKNVVSNWDLTVQGAIVYLDMINNKKKWQEMAINPSHLTPPFLEHFKLINNIYPGIKENKQEVQWLKCLLYIQLSPTDRKVSFPIIAKLIDEDENILNKLELKRPSKEGGLPINDKTSPKNSLHLTYNGSLVSLQTVQNILLGKYLADFENDDNNKRPDTVQGITKYCAYRTAGNSHEQALIGLTKGLGQMFKANPTSANWYLSHPVLAKFTTIPLIRALFQTYIEWQVQKHTTINKQEELIRNPLLNNNTQKNSSSYGLTLKSIGINAKLTPSLRENIIPTTSSEHSILVPKTPMDENMESSVKSDEVVEKSHSLSLH